MMTEPFLLGSETLARYWELLVVGSVSTLEDHLDLEDQGQGCLVPGLPRVVVPFWGLSGLLRMAGYYATIICNLRTQRKMS